MVLHKTVIYGTGSLGNEQEELMSTQENRENSGILPTGCLMSQPPLTCQD